MLKMFFKSVLWSSPVALVFSWMFLYSKTGDDFIWQLRQLSAYKSLGMQDLTTICFFEWFIISMIFLCIPIFLSFKSDTENAVVINGLDVSSVILFGFALLLDLDIFLSLGIMLYIFSLVWGLFEVIKCNYKGIASKHKTDVIKSEIVNNERFLNLKKAERIKYLQDLKEQTLVEITKLQKELEKESNKYKDMPADVIKYVKRRKPTKQIYNVTKLKNKIIAIDELIKSENQKPKEKKKITD